ncbi:MAG: AAA family ATPase [Thermales bacterium]|nr:AAA family ATPase [Thermales bacterium]
MKKCQEVDERILLTFVGYLLSIGTMIISNHLQENDQKNKIQSKAQEELADLNAQLKEFENNLRPKNMNAYIGQKKVVRQLKLIIDSANIRSVLPEHIMFYGQPGLGKTTLASLISNELGAHLKTIAAPALQKSGDVVSLLINMEPNTILLLMKFIDSKHLWKR